MDRGSCLYAIFLLVSLLGADFCEGSSITSCSGSPRALDNQEAVLSANLQVPTTYACIDLSGSKNSIFHGNNLYDITATTGDFGIAIYVSNAENLTISNVNFVSSSISIINSKNITITLCTFSGIDQGTTPGIASSNVTGLRLINNSFSGNATLQSDLATNIEVNQNTFTNVYTQQNVLHLTEAYHFTVSGNTFTQCTAINGIHVETTSSFLDSGGDVAGNSLLGGTYQYPIAVSLNGQVEFYVTNNLISGTTGTCQASTGFIKVQSLAGKPSVSISNNFIEHYNGPCAISPFNGIDTGHTTFEMNDNRVNDVAIVRTDVGTDWNVIYFGNFDGSIKNITITNVNFIDHTFTGTNGLNVMYQPSTCFIQADDVYMQNMTVADTLNCNPSDQDCISAPGKLVVGISSAGSFAGKNIYMKDFTAGNAGLVNKINSSSLVFGGSAYGLIGSNSNYSISNMTLINFKAGNSGSLQSGGEKDCSEAGSALAYAHWYSDGANGGALFPYSPTILPNIFPIFLSGFLNGISNCADAPDPPKNTTITFGRTSFTLFWTQVSGMSYRIDTFTGSDPFANKYMGANSSATISGLNANTSCHVRLSAFNGTAYSSYVYFLFTTLPLTPPAQPSVLQPEYSTSSVRLNWAAGDDGGDPITTFTVQMFNNSVWSTVYSGNQTSCTVPGLNASTTYQFRISATNSLGAGEFNLINLTTPAITCGDGRCELPETCNNCVIDCGSCGFPPCAGSPECSGGVCSYGTCACPSGKSGSDCGLSSTPIVINVNSSSPTSAISVRDPQPNSFPQFTIHFHDITEIDSMGNIISSFDLSQQTFTSFTVTPENGTDSYSEIYFTTTLPNMAFITIYIYDVTQDHAFPFANSTINVSANSLKYSMKIENWPFAKYGNQLKVTMEAMSQNSTNACTDIHTDNENANLLWVQVRLNGVVLYGRFTSTALIDAESLFFWDQAEFDPDFQLLMDDGHYGLCPPPRTPASPNPPTYREYSANSITVNWTAGDDGGLPVTNFTLQMLNNSAWTTKYSGNNTRYKVSGLEASTTYQFRVAASNSLGQGNYSDSASISTAPKICGDGTCDTGSETCSTCFLDCGSCGYPPCPGTPQCNGGTCVNGTCGCPNGKTGSACEYSSMKYNRKVDKTTTNKIANNPNFKKCVVYQLIAGSSCNHLAQASHNIMVEPA